jgi:hypothetical protein
MKITVYGELCCDDCGEIIHNHFDCPSCGLEYAPSDAYHDLGHENPAIIGCEKCHARFQLIHGDWYDGDWTQIGASA